MTQQTMILEVFRYHPEQGTEAWFDRYEVPYRADWVVLDALNYLKDEVDGTLAYRWSCRMGICGSCGMLVNGEPKLSCAAFLRDYAEEGTIRVEPLTHFRVQRDLVIDMEPFMERLEQVQPYIVRDDVQDVEAGPYQQTEAERERYAPHAMCINCMLCYAACPVTGLEPEFIGPAALAIGHRYNRDSRDDGADQRLERMGGAEGVWACTTVGECSVVCPKHVDPAGAIQQAKVQAALRSYQRLIMPKADAGEKQA